MRITPECRCGVVVAGAAQLECVLVDEHHHGLGVVADAAAAVGQHERLDEHLHGGDDLQHQQHDEDQPGLRDRDVPDPPEQARPLELGRLVQLARDVLQRGQVDQRRAAHVHPGRRDHHRDHRGADEPGARLEHPLRGRQVQDAQDVVEQTVLRVVEVGEQQQRRGRRQHHRQVDQHPQVAPGVPQLVEQDRHAERDREPDDEREQGELERVPPGDARTSGHGRSIL